MCLSVNGKMLLVNVVVLCSVMLETWSTFCNVFEFCGYHYAEEW